MHAVLSRAIPLVASLALAASAHAQSAWPARSITLVVPFAAGGNNDVSGRIVARKLADLLGQPVIVENKTGAGGTIGSAAVATARPDGYTLGFLSSGPVAAAVSLQKSLPYDPRKDLLPVARVTTSPSVLVVNPVFPAKDLAEFVAYAKQNPGKVNYGTAGPGSSPHLAGALFESMAGATMVAVAYRGGAPALADLMGGQIQAVFNPILEVMPQVRAGKLRALAVTTTKRSSLLPDVPALGERYPGYEVLTWNGVFAPPGTPGDVVAKLNEAVRKVLADPEVVAKLADLGLEVAFSSPAEFGAFVNEQIESFAKLVRIAKVEPN
ncbi:MAG: tripartite tricarboxylate transporter substrate binding protein [Betaproteobacteria bacterium]|nr:tripartite tricarboxylate transporter substrate binding protein [Betaproteobacteria bacterium]